MVNKNLKTKTQFKTYSEAVNHVYDSLEACGMKVARNFLWPALKPNTPVRLQLSIEGLDKPCVLVIYFCQLEKHIECIAHYKEN